MQNEPTLNTKSVNDKYDTPTLENIQAGKQSLDKNSTEYRFRTAIGKVYKIGVPVIDMNLDVPLMEWGITSVTFMEVILGLEDEFDIEFDMKTLSIQKLACVRNLFNQVKSMLNE